MNIKDVPIDSESQLPVLKEFQTRQQRNFKANLPDDTKSWKAGNGEGCWFQALSKEDMDNCQNSNYRGSISAILLNDSIYWPALHYGTVVRLECRACARPVLDVEWLHTILLLAGVDFKAMLDEEEGEQELVNG